MGRRRAKVAPGAGSRGHLPGHHGEAPGKTTLQSISEKLRGSKPQASKSA